MLIICLSLQWFLASYISHWTMDIYTTLNDYWKWFNFDSSAIDFDCFLFCCSFNFKWWFQMVISMLLNSSNFKIILSISFQLAQNNNIATDTIINIVNRNTLSIAWQLCLMYTQFKNFGKSIYERASLKV